MAEDKRIQSFFKRGRYPTADEVCRVLVALSREESHTLAEIADETHVSRRHAQVILYLLAQEKLAKSKRAGFVRRGPDHVEAAPLHGMVTGFEERTEQDTKRLDDMMHYAQSAECRRQMLRVYFGEPRGERCTACDNCVNHPVREQKAAVAAVLPSVRASVRTEAAPSTTFAIGARGAHVRFGKGTILAVEDDTVTVRFGPKDCRRLKASFLEAAA